MIIGKALLIIGKALLVIGEVSLIIGNAPKYGEEPPKIRGRLSLTLGKLPQIRQEASQHHGNASRYCETSSVTLARGQNNRLISKIISMLQNASEVGFATCKAVSYMSHVSVLCSMACALLYQPVTACMMPAGNKKGKNKK